MSLLRRKSCSALASTILESPLHRTKATCTIFFCAICQAALPGRPFDTRILLYKSCANQRMPSAGGRLFQPPVLLYARASSRRFSRLHGFFPHLPKHIIRNLVNIVIQPIGIQIVAVGTPLQLRPFGRVIIGIIVFRYLNRQSFFFIPHVFVM